MKQVHGCCFVGVIVHGDKSDLDAPNCRVVFPMEQYVTAMKLAHDSDLVGHCGVRRI